MPPTQPQRRHRERGTLVAGRPYLASARVASAAAAHAGLPYKRATTMRFCLPGGSKTSAARKTPGWSRTPGRPLMGWTARRAAVLQVLFRGPSIGKARCQPCDSSNQVIVRPPRRRAPHLVASPATIPSPRPPSASSPGGRSSGSPGPLRSVTSTRTVPVQAVTVTVTVSPGRPELLCRTLLPKSSLASRTASSPQGCPGPSTAPTNARTTRARSPRPATLTLSRTFAPAISAPAFPSARKHRKSERTHANARSPQPPTSSRICVPGADRRKSIRRDPPRPAHTAG